MAQVLISGTSWSQSDRIGQKIDLIGMAELSGTNGDDRMHGRRTPDTLNGRGGDDVLNGRYGYDTLNGDRGNDLLKGSGGRDILTGGSGNDILYGGTERQEFGGDGRDQLDGGGGDDRLYGGWESDTLTGGGGKDRFTYLEVSDSTVDSPDFLLDFEQGKDTLAFRGAFKEGDLHFVGNAEFSQVAGEVRFEAFDDAQQSVIDIDVDGDGATDLRIAFTSAIHFEASDFSF